VDLRRQNWNVVTGGNWRQPARLRPHSKDNDLPAMPDALAPRLKYGVIAPATNTIVQPEYDAMRPRGVSNQMARVVIPDSPVGTESEFAAMMGQVRGSLEGALDAVMGCSPAAVVFGMSAETFWEGVLDANALQAHLEARAGVKVILGVQACQAAIQRYGGIRRISLITPYMPSGDAQVRRSFTDSGFEVVNLLGLKCNSPLLMAHEPPERLRRAVREVDDSSVELILQVGTNLAFSLVAAEAERWLGKPVLAVNTCTYWHALRSTGIEDKIEGFGSLLTEH
jgi:maleate isomerase